MDVADFVGSGLFHSLGEFASLQVDMVLSSTTMPRQPRLSFRTLPSFVFYGLRQKPSILSITLLFGAVSVGRADTLYQFSINTSSISGTAGSFDLQFNPGPLVSQLALLQIPNFTSDGTLASGPTLTGDISDGPLPATLTFDNGAGFNDYFEGFTFGSTLLFKVRLYGPAVNSPDGTSTSGSTFAFSMFSDSAGTIPALTTDLTNGFAAMVDINLTGSATVTNFSPQTSISPVNAAPEPSSIVLIVTAVALILTLLRFKRRAQT